MHRLCGKADFDQIWATINDGADAYRGVIPHDCWHEPYMTQQELHSELTKGVVFWGYEKDGILQGVMGMQNVQDVTLIRHAYVKTILRRRGIGSSLLNHIKALAERPLLIGAWVDATWAIRFYEKHGFRVVEADRKEHLLRRYWGISERQIEASVVLCQRSPYTPDVN